MNFSLELFESKTYINAFSEPIMKENSLGIMMKYEHLLNWVATALAGYHQLHDALDDSRRDSTLDGIPCHATSPLLPTLVIREHHKYTTPAPTLSSNQTASVV